MRTPLLLVCGEELNAEEIVRHLVRIGYDVFDGYVEGGVEAWEQSRLPTASHPVLTAGELREQLERGAGPLPLDVRFHHEWQLGHVPAASHIELGELPDQAGSLDKKASYATLCAAGARAWTAASLLERAEFTDVKILEGGTDAWREAGYPLAAPEADGAG